MDVLYWWQTIEVSGKPPQNKQKAQIYDKFYDQQKINTQNADSKINNKPSNSFGRAKTSV